MSVSKFSVVAGTTVLAGLLSLGSGCASDEKADACAKCEGGAMASAEPTKDEGPRKPLEQKRRSAHDRSTRR